jgi:hypothetical protein
MMDISPSFFWNWSYNWWGDSSTNNSCNPSSQRFLGMPYLHWIGVVFQCLLLWVLLSTWPKNGYYFLNKTFWSIPLVIFLPSLQYSSIECAPITYTTCWKVVVHFWIENNPSLSIQSRCYMKNSSYLFKIFQKSLWIIF